MPRCTAASCFEVSIGISHRVIENQTLRELQTIFDGRIGSVVDKVCSIFDVVGSNAAGLILVKRLKPECLAKIFLMKTHNCSVARVARAQPASVVARHGNGARNAGHKVDFGNVDPARFRAQDAEGAAVSCSARPGTFAPDCQASPLREAGPAETARFPRKHTLLSEAADVRKSPGR